jgi:hypothetical protein
MSNYSKMDLYVSYLQEVETVLNSIPQDVLSTVQYKESGIVKVIRDIMHETKAMHDDYESFIFTISQDSMLDKTFKIYFLDSVEMATARITVTNRPITFQITLNEINKVNLQVI